VLADKLRGGLRITATDAAAHRCGLRIGMALAEARARIPNILVGEADLAADQELLLELAASCEIFTPLVALDEPHGLTLDITGCAHLFGGEPAMRDRACMHVEQRRLTPHISIAGTPDVAHVLARFSPSLIVSEGDEEKVVWPLPITALGSSTEITLALTRAGLKTLGDLAKRPSQILSARFGIEPVTRLHRILGRENIRITPLRPPPDVTAEQHFPEPLLDMENLHAVVIQLCREITFDLERLGTGGRVFEAVFFRPDGKIRRLAIETAQATRDLASLIRLIALRMETLADPLDPGFGFDAIRLSVLRSEPLGQKQNQLDGKAEDDSAIGALIDRLVIRFGKDRVMRFVARDTHDPQRAAAFVPMASDAGSAEWRIGEDPLPRPLQLFHPPQPIDAIAEVPDGPPRRFRWRKVLHEVAAAEGPERIEPEWWRAGKYERPRDYYYVENSQGRRFWIFREGLFIRGQAPPRWFLHGLFP
jgi:protein ImuB